MEQKSNNSAITTFLQTTFLQTGPNEIKPIVVQVSSGATAKVWEKQIQPGEKKKSG
jgi:hypothetical protein